MLFTIGRADYHENMQVSLEHIYEACRQVDEYFLPVGKIVAEEVAREETNNLQNKILGTLKRAGGRVNRRDLLKALHARLTDVESAIGALCESEEIVIHQVEDKKRNKPQIWYDLNINEDLGKLENRDAKEDCPKSRDSRISRNSPNCRKNSIYNNGIHGTDATLETDETGVKTTHNPLAGSGSLPPDRTNPPGSAIEANQSDKQVAPSIPTAQTLLGANPGKAVDIDHHRQSENGEAMVTTASDADQHRQSENGEAEEALLSTANIAEANKADLYQKAVVSSHDSQIVYPWEKDIVWVRNPREYNFLREVRVTSRNPRFTDDDNHITVGYTVNFSEGECMEIFREMIENQLHPNFEIRNEYRRRYFYVRPSDLPGHPEYTVGQRAGVDYAPIEAVDPTSIKVGRKSKKSPEVGNLAPQNAEGETATV